jgi:hypothetical protein
MSNFKVGDMVRVKSSEPMKIRKYSVFDGSQHVICEDSDGEFIGRYHIDQLEMAPITPSTDEVEAVARAIMKAEGCGFTIDGNHVLCCDASVGDQLDAYGKPLKPSDEACTCRVAAIAAIAALAEWEGK